jgi:hypothetical protein
MTPASGEYVRHACGKTGGHAAHTWITFMTRFRCTGHPDYTVTQPDMEWTLAAHPCFDRAYRIYRNAIVDWHASDAIQDAAATLGMTARQYADARLDANQFQYVAASTGDEFTRAHLDLAYRRAVDDACGVTRA